MINPLSIGLCCRVIVSKQFLDCPRIVMKLPIYGAPWMYIRSVLYHKPCYNLIGEMLLSDSDMSFANLNNMQDSSSVMDEFNLSSFFA